MTGHLLLTCRKCTREAKIPAPTLAVAVELAKLQGWVSEKMGRETAYVCPKCPAIRTKAA